MAAKADFTRVVNLREERYDVFMGRPGPWGNPFKIGRDGTRAEVIGRYAELLLMNPQLRLRAKRELKGKRLGCYCKPLECHADLLADVAKR